MKPKNFDQFITEKYISYQRYVVRRIFSPDGYIEISPEDDYNQNYDEYDLNNVIDFIIENENEYDEELKIIKITEEIIDDSVIELRKTSKKFNL